MNQMRHLDAQHGSVTLPLVLALALCLGVLAGTDGNIAFAVAPVAATLFVTMIWKLPMRYLAHGLLFAALLVDNPTERPGRNLYKSFLLPPGNALYEAVSKTFHVPGAKFTGLELILLVFVVILLIRMLMGHPVDGEGRKQAAAPLMQACLVSIGALLGLEFYGMARGGSFAHSLLQMRTMLFLPFMTMFFAYSFKKRSDAQVLMGTIITVAVLRAFLCIYYWATFMRAVNKEGGESGDGSYVTTHSDSILAAVAIIMCLVWVYQRPQVSSYVMTALVVPVVGLGIVLNNRRIAFVAVAMGFFFSYLASGRMFQRRVHQTVLAMLPLMLVYTAVGWKAQGSWAKPVQTLKSVLTQKDTSSATRDIENFNLLETMKRNLLIGSGFGHEYIEKVKAFDISKIFEAYRYVPHNSVLWFWGVGGVVGFSLFWMFLVVGVFLAARLCRFAETSRQTVLAMTAMSAVIAWASQCFGDMGLMSWMGSLTVASLLGCVGSLAVEVGAWQGKNAMLVAMQPAGGTGALPAASAPTYRVPPSPGGTL